MNTSRTLFNPFRALPVAFALIFNVLIGPVLPLAATPVGAAEPTVTLQDDVNGCMGVRTTPGSDHTTKELIGGTLEPGGTARFRFTFPATVNGNPGQEEWRLTDCVFLNGDPYQKFDVTALENDVSPVVIEFDLNIPSDAPIGAEYCNYGKTTESPSDAQASNRKAGPACFFIGGGIRVLKVDQDGQALPNAEFTVDCTWPTTTAFLPDTIVNAGGQTYTRNSTSAGSFSQAVTTGADGVISVTGPEATSCTFTETSPPNGYDGPATLTKTLTISAQAQATFTFVNTLRNPILEVSKTADDATVNAGEQIGFTIDVDSTGTSTVTGATLNDPLPGGSGVNWSIDPAYSGPGTCSVSGTAPTQTLSCSFGDLAAGAGTSVHVVSDTTAASCKEYLNTATADADNFGAVTATDSTTVECPDLDLQKTPDGATIQAGDKISFTLSLTNNGAGTATNVNIDDTLPAGFTWSLDPDKSGCAITSGVLHCDIASLASGASFAVTVSAPTDETDCSTTAYTNHATADADNHAEVSNDGDVTIVCADVGVEKSGNGPINAGDAATFTIVVTTSGNADSTNVTLTDDLPVGVTWTLGGADAAACSIDTAATPDSLSCDFGTMSPDATKTITLSGTAGTGTCPIISNTAEVGSDFDTDASNDSSTATITVNCPNLTITKSADNGTISAGDLAEYTIVVTNEGPGTATNVHLDEQLPTGVEWSVSVDDPSPAGGCADSDGTTVPQTITCDFASLADGASVTLHLSGQTDAADCGTLHNVATVSGDNENPQMGDDNEASADVVVECPGLNIAKSAVDDSVISGDTASFEIVVWNTGPGTAHNVTVSDALPGGLAWTENSENCSIAGSTLSCSFGDLGIGTFESSDARVTVSAETTSESCGELKNVAVASADNNKDVDDDATIAVHCPTLVIDKTANRDQVDVTAGKDTTVLWTLTYTLSDGPVTHAVISDPIPTGLNYVDGSASNGGTYDAASRTLTWTFASLAENGTVSFKTTVDASVGGGATFLNVTTIDSDETAPDTGQDSVGTVEQEQQGSTGTPAPSVPNTALGAGGNGQPLSVPIELMLLVFIGSLGGLTLANVKAVRRRR